MHAAFNLTRQLIFWHICGTDVINNMYKVHVLNSSFLLIFFFILNFLYLEKLISILRQVKKLAWQIMES